MRGRPPRLLMTADAVGGVWTYALDLARGLDESGVHVTLAVLGPSPTADQLAEVRDIPGLRIVDTGLALDWMAMDLRAMRDTAIAIERLSRSVRADLVHLNSPSLAGCVRFAVPVVGACHSCLATWWESVGQGEMPRDFVWRTAAYRRGLAACDLLVAPTAAFARATARAHRLSAPIVVPNGRRFEPGIAGARQRCVFSAGRLWDPGKGIALLDAAAGALDVEVYVAGDLRGPANQRVTLQHARPLGQLAPAAVRQWLARVEIFASAALYEPFGLSVLEAATSGCALVLSDIPAFRELWGNAAVFFPAGDGDALAMALRRLLDRPDRIATLGAAARRRAAGYTAEAMSGAMLRLYGSLSPAMRWTAHREAAA